jgi:hypothetical protein
MSLLSDFNRAAVHASAFLKNRATALAESMNPNRLVVQPPKDVAEAVEVSTARRRFQPKLTGLQIAAVRKAKRSLATNRTARSRYTPNGISARNTRALRRLIDAQSTTATAAA